MLVQTANLIILDKNKQKILLFKRVKKDKEQNKWSIVGGTLENNETFEDCLIREVKEEIDCKIKEFTFFKQYRTENENSLQVNTKYYFGVIIDKIKLNELELSEYKWFNFDINVLKLELAYNQKEVIADFLHYCKFK